jgi:hypothetical protein
MENEEVENGRFSFSYFPLSIFYFPWQAVKPDLVYSRCE